MPSCVPKTESCSKFCIYIRLNNDPEVFTLEARRLTASSRCRWISGVLGQLLDCKVLLLLDGGVACGGWLRGNSELWIPAAHPNTIHVNTHVNKQINIRHRNTTALISRSVSCKRQILKSSGQVTNLEHVKTFPPEQWGEYCRYKGMCSVSTAKLPLSRSLIT